MRIALLYIIGSILIFASCDAKYTDVFDETGLKVSKKEVSFKQDTRGITLRVSGVFNWDIDTAGIASWCKVITVKDHNATDYLTIHVEENKGVSTRRTSFNVVSKNDVVPITVIQIGNEPTVLSSKGDSLSFSLDKTMVEIELTTNIEFSSSIEYIEAPTGEKWLTFDKPYVNDEIPIRIGIMQNTTGDDRKAKIIFSDKSSDYKKEILIFQSKGAVEYGQGDVSDINGNHKLKIASANASTSIDNKGIELSYDGNVITHFQSTWQPIAEPVVLEYHFNGEKSLDYVVYTPYSGDVTKSFALTEIWTKSTGEEYKLTKTVKFVGEKRQTVMFAEQVKNPESVKFIVKSVNGTDKNFIVAACAEMDFYSSDLQYSHIFADKSYSSLKEGVTLANIFDMKDEFFRNIAEYLYHNRYPMIRINRYEAYPVVQSRNKMDARGMFDNVTGISVKQDEEVVVMVDNLKAQSVTLPLFTPGDNYFTYEYQLADGINKFKMLSDGLLYVKYHTNSTTAQPITIHIAGGTVNGYYDSQNQSEEKGMEQLRAASAPYFDLRGKYVHLILPTQALRDNATSLKALVDKYDRIVELQQEFTGLAAFNKIVKNRLCIMPSATALSTQYIALLPSADVNDFCSADRITGEVLWKIATRVSAFHQPSDLRNWIPAQKDLYTAYVQWVMDGETTLNAASVHDKAYYKFFVAEENLPNKTIAVDETRIIPFWQQFLYVSEVLGKKDVFKTLHKEIIESTKAVTESGYMTKCNTLSGTIFNDFYAQWHFTGVATGGTIPTAASLRYLNEKNLDMYKNVQPIVAGTFSVKSKDIVVNGNVLTIYTATVENTQNAVAYEVMNMGFLAQASNSTTFVIDNYKSVMKIIAVGANGERVEIRKK